MSRRAMLRWGIPVFLFLVIFTIYWAPSVAAFFYDAIAFLSPLWLPALLMLIAWPLWLAFARSYFASRVPYATIELRPGPETPRTARPMELVFYSLYHRTAITRKDFLMGRIRMPWSFEAYVHAGNARFFIHLPSDHVAAVEARVRAEYHDVNIEKTRDYSREIAFSPFAMRAVAREYALTKPDPYPLRTYESYEQAEGKRDRFSDLLEELTVAGPNEHFLVSFIVRPHQRDRQNYFEEPRDTLHEDAYRVIAGIVGKSGDVHSLPAATREIVAAIEAALKKPSFDCGIRALYVAEGASFSKEHAGLLDTLFDRFNDDALNGFVATDPAERVGFLHRELFALSPQLKSEYLMRLFRRRSFFAPPYVGKAFILNTEELATVYHLPQAGRGGAVSHRSGVALEAPANLPV